jgi:transcriptional regulator of arginine metabolism
MKLLIEQRRRAMADLIRDADLSSQADLAARMAKLGFAMTQATISRDLDHIGAVKVRRGGALVYALPEAPEAGAAGGSELSKILRDWARSIAPAASRVVIKTPPGSAHLVGVALDRSGLDGVAGTLCGDDTVFVATKDAASAKSCAAELLALRSRAG